MSELIIPNLTGFEWRDVRRAIAAAIVKIAPLATVHQEWKLEFDPQTAIGKFTGMLNGKDAHSGFVHSFMIGLSGETENTNGTGTFATIGGATCDYNLTFAVWGFYDYQSWRVAFATNTPIADAASEQNATAFAETERRALKAIFRVNPTLGNDSGRIRYVFPPVLESADNHPFSNGKQILIVQNSVVVRVRESFA